MAIWYPCHNLTPLDQYSLQAIIPNRGSSYADLVDGDIALLYLDDLMSVYVYDIDSVEAENLPLVVKPDGSTGAGRWIRKSYNQYHNLLINIDGGAVDDYHHLTLSQHTDLTDGGDTVLHDHDGISENTTHRSSDGKDHSDVVLNNTHRTGAGSDHSDVAANTAARHAESHTITSHSDVVDATGAELEELTGGGDTVLHDHDGITENTAARHAESHTIASHSDTTATGANLNTLVGGSETSLHYHNLISDNGEIGIIHTENAGPQLNYDGSKVVDVVSRGLDIRDSDGTDSPYVELLDSSGLPLARFGSNFTATTLVGYGHGDNFVIQAENTSGSNLNVFTGNADGEATLYYAGTKALVTDEKGVSVWDTSGAEPYVYLKDDAGNILGAYLFFSGDFIIKGYSNGANIYLRQNNTAGTTNHVLEGDPDAGTALYYTGLKAIVTTATGLDVLDTSGNDPRLTLKTDADGSVAQLLGSSTDFIIRGLNHGANIHLQQEDAGGTVCTIIEGDPDGATTIYYDNTKAMASSVSGIEVYDTSGNDPKVDLYSSAANHIGYLGGVGDTDIYLSCTEDSSDVWLEAKTAGSASVWVGLVGPDGSLRPSGNKAVDLGTAAIAWDTLFADDFTNVADFYWMDDRKDADGNIVPINDEEVISSILPSAEYDALSGLRRINDSTIPTWLAKKHSKAGQLLDSSGDIVQTWERGDVAYNSDGKPYLSLKTMISLLMGATRQQRDRMHTMHNRINVLEARLKEA